MRLLFAAALLFWQMSSPPGADPAAEPIHLRYLRSIHLPPHATGQACAELDASTLAHTASRFNNDLRLFSGPDDLTASPTEVPFALTESASRPVEPGAATVEDVHQQNGDLVFDLRMPTQLYTDVQLDLAAHNFVATATVSGQKSPSAPAVPLGAFTLFDLTARHLARSTTIPLQESSYPLLHIVLRLRPASGSPASTFAPSIVRGAEVPPSRETQTLYTTVAETTHFTQRGQQTIAVLRIPAHVPVERIAFLLDPAFHGNFLRHLQITARPDPVSQRAATEIIPASISSVTLAGTTPDSMQSGTNHRLAIDTALGANLRDNATVTIAIDNGGDPPLPLRAVRLAMRQRMICFQAVPSAAPYTLRYGDAELPPPVYDYAQTFQPAPDPIEAKLGPERLNPEWEPQADTRSYAERHPELVWVGLLIAIAVVGGAAVESLKKRGKRY